MVFPEGIVVDTTNRTSAGTDEISNFDLVKDPVIELEYVNTMDCIRHTEHSPFLISDSFLVHEPSGLPTPEEQKWSDH